MKLFEYEAKELARKHGIPVPKGVLVRTPQEAYKAAEELGPIVLKAQVLVGRRGLAGGVKPAETPDDAYRVAENLLGSEIRGEKVSMLLAEEKICFEKEYYLSLTIDRTNRGYAYLVSPLGGVEIEELVKEHPEMLLKLPADPLVGYSSYMARTAAKFLGIPKTHWKELDNIMKTMYEIMLKYDAELVEFNPLAWKCGGGLIALDAKINIDDNSLFKHPEFLEKAGRDLTEDELLAKKHGFSYVELDGDIGIICNGAGLTMATMDLVAYYGGNPANFLDIGGGANRKRVKEAAKLVLRKPGVKVLLVNIFGGITRCDEVAKGIVEAVEETGINKSIVIRLLGTNEEEGRKILEEKGFNVYSEVDNAVKKAVEIASQLRNEESPRR